MRMAEYKQIHKVEVEKKPFKLTKKMIALLVIYDCHLLAR